jgi:EAL domain-containing protein (putative c-di-GMP-specific phosphodiesterase class I)
MNGWQVDGRSKGGRVLIVEDDEPLRRAFARVLQRHGYEVVVAADGREAAQWVANASGLDAIVSDIHMPQMSGIDLLRIVRDGDPDLPMILVTANPQLPSAMEAVEHGAHKYLTKPVDLDALSACVGRAVTLRRMARLKREALAVMGQEALQMADRAVLEASFKSAMATAWMAYQPIVRARDGQLHGYEALLRTLEPSLPHPGAVIEAAQRLGRLDDLGRRVRSLAPEPMSATSDTLLFVNLHPADLADDQLFVVDSPLGRVAPRVVLEVTERTTLDQVPNVRDRLARLRKLGFRLALDDLGAGYAGLTSFATMEPEIVKLDMTLIRGIDANPVKRTVVEKMTSLAHELNVGVVAEGVETMGERNVLIAIGCDLLQGYLFGKPGRAFPEVRRVE